MDINKVKNLRMFRADLIGCGLQVKELSALGVAERIIELAGEKKHTVNQEYSYWVNARNPHAEFETMVSSCLSVLVAEREESK
jgi:hypothetical protein